MGNELVFKSNDQIVTSSRNVAKDFGKRHDNVLRDIDNLIKNKILTDSEVTKSTYIHWHNNQEYREYLLTEKAYKKIKARYQLQKRRSNSNQIYVLKHRGIDGFFKIGITSNIHARIPSLNTASPLGIEIVYLNKTEKARKIESLVHQKLQKNHCNGEWFQLNKVQLEEIISMIEKEVEKHESISI